MVYEIAVLPIKADQTEAFQRAFGEVVHLLARAQGYLGHQLLQGVEDPSQFNLIVQWRSVEDHTQGFEPSENHAVFMRAVEGYLAGEPTVYHVQAAGSAQGVDI